MVTNQRGPPREKISESSAHGKPGSADLHCLQHPRVSQLVQDNLWVKHVGVLQIKGDGGSHIKTLWMSSRRLLEVWDQANLLHVGFYAADEERVGHAESGHESMEGVLGRRKEMSTFPGPAP